MPARRLFSLFAAPLLLITAFLGISGTAPAGAASAGFTLDMVDGGGQLKLASSAEPFQMENPTTIAGTIDDETGEMSDVTFTTPDINFQQEASPGLVADITAKFTTLSTSGSADGLGNVTINASVKLDVHVDVAGGAITADCVSQPVNLALTSTAPYDPETGLVTLADGNFTIPPTADDEACNPLVAGPINEQLAGSGNSISIQVAGELALPAPPGDPSTTTLTADTDSTPLGSPVTFTATVEPAATTGSVAFLDGTNPLGMVQMGEDGTASFTTSSLGIGAHTITAKFSGNADLQGSTSAPVTHTVTATPSVRADLPGYVIAGGDPAEFSATITNPAAGAAISNLRLDMKLGNLFRMSSAYVTLEWNDGGTWTPVALTGTSTMTGSFPDATGFALAPGESRTVDFRLTVTDAIPNKGRVPVEFTLVDVDPDSEPAGAVLTTYNSMTGETWIVDPGRFALTPQSVEVSGFSGSAEHLRVGDTIQILSRFTRDSAAGSSTYTTGDADVFIDGDLVGTKSIGNTGSVNYAIMGGPDSLLNDLAPGEHTVSVYYHGDSVWLPAVVSGTFTLAPFVGQRYTCSLSIPGSETATFMMRVDAQATAPVSALPGTTVHLGRVGISYWSQGVPNYLALLGGNPDASSNLTMSLSGRATGSYTGVTAPEQPATDPEGQATLSDVSVSVPVEGEPGDVIDVNFLGSSMAVALAPGVNLPLPCEANGDGIPLASTVVAGTKLSTTATNPVVEGTSVPLTANVYPATAQGQVEFYDGSTLIGIAPVSDGVATTNVSTLSTGSHQITAKYSGDLANPPSTADAIEVTVRDAIECADQAQPGNPATVRATYLLLLGRCGDADGFSYWVNQLDSGVSVESFAAQIANTLEAHKRSVDDAYQLVLDRAPDSAGRNFWGQRLERGGRYDVLIGDIAASDEFYAQAGGTNAGWVDLAYQRILQRTPDADGKAYWLNRLDQGESRASIAATMVRLDEPTGTLVKEAYLAILDRRPTTDELKREVPKFQATMAAQPRPVPTAAVPAFGASGGSDMGDSGDEHHLGLLGDHDHR